MMDRLSKLSLSVAPREGAWIETMMDRLSKLSLSVAPREGAWIETATNCKNMNYKSRTP